MHIRTRNELIGWLEDNYPGRTARAVQEGHTENLGLFERIPPNNKPGWIIRLTSKFGTTWYAVIQQGKATKPGTFIVWARTGVPWKYWMGDTCNSLLHQGDNPEEYKEMRDGR